MIPEQTRNGYLISTDKSKLNIEMIHQYLCNESYWAKGIPEATVRKSIEGSVCFAVYFHNEQVGFARVITDNATFAYLADVFILPEHRGKGLSKWMMQVISTHPGLQGLRRWMLATKDAHGLYAQFGFTVINNNGRFMELHNPNVYMNK